MVDGPHGLDPEQFKALEKRAREVFDEKTEKGIITTYIEELDAVLDERNIEHRKDVLGAIRLEKIRKDIKKEAKELSVSEEAEDEERSRKGREWRKR